MSSGAIFELKIHQNHASAATGELERSPRSLCFQEAACFAAWDGEGKKREGGEGERSKKGRKEGKGAFPHNLCTI